MKGVDELRRKEKRPLRSSVLQGRTTQISITG